MQHIAIGEEQPNVDSQQITTMDLQSATEDTSSLQNVNGKIDCREVCCSSDQAFQPQDNPTLSSFVRKDHKFLTAWVAEQTCIMLCISKRKGYYAFTAEMLPSIINVHKG